MASRKFIFIFRIAFVNWGFLRLPQTIFYFISPTLSNQPGGERVFFIVFFFRPDLKFKGNNQGLIFYYGVTGPIAAGQLGYFDFMALQYHGFCQTQDFFVGIARIVTAHGLRLLVRIISVILLFQNNARRDNTQEKNHASPSISFAFSA